LEFDSSPPSPLTSEISAVFYLNNMSLELNLSGKIGNGTKVDIIYIFFNDAHTMYCHLFF
jgi:hypothetical protein